MRQKRGAVRRRTWWPFALLCVVTSSRWVLVDVWPRTESTLRTEAFGCGIGMILCAAVAVYRRKGAPGVVWVLCAIAVGAALLAAPAVGATLRGPASGPFDRMFALCFVPVLVSVLGAASTDQRGQMRLWPGLAAVAGGLLLFPLAMPTTLTGCLGLVLPPVVIAAACGKYRDAMRGISREWGRCALVGGGSLGLIAIGAWRADGGAGVAAVSWIGVGLDALVAGLLVMSAARLNAAEYASLYVVVPLLTVLEGLAILRPHLQPGSLVRLCAGVALLAGAAAGLWRRTEVSPVALRLSQ